MAGTNAEFLIKIRADAADAQRAMREAGANLKGVGRQVADLNRVGQRFDLRGVSQQLSQVGQSSMATGNFVQSLAVQLPDLGLALGPVGAAAGLAAGLILPLATNLLNLGEASQTAEERAQAMEERLATLNSAVDAYVASSRLAGLSTAELEGKYGSATDAARTFIATLREIDQVNAGEAVSASLDDLSTRLGAFGDEVVVHAGESVNAQIEEARRLAEEASAAANNAFLSGSQDFPQLQQALAEASVAVEDLERFRDALVELQDKYDLTDKAAINLALRLNELGRAEGVDNQTAAAANLSAALLDAFESVEAMPPVVRDLYAELSAAASKAAEMQGAAEGAANVFDTLRGLTVDVNGEAVRLDETFEGLGESFLARLREALRLANEINDRSVDAYRQYQGSRRAGMFVPSGAVEASAALLRQLENPGGIWTTPHWDVDQLRIGYSSDTITRADGTVQRGINSGDTVTQEAAERDLERRIREAHAEIAALVGEGRFAILSDAQKAALTSIHYNYGSVGEGGANIADVVRTGDVEAIARAIEGLSANPERRQVEADIFRSGGGVQGAGERVTAAEEREAAAATREAEEAARKSEAARKAEAEAVEAAQAAYDSLIGSMDPATARQNALAEGQRVVNEALARGAITATEAATAMDLLAARYSADEVAQATQAIIEGGADAAEAAQAAAQEARDTTRGLIDDLLHGATAAEAFANVLGKVGSQFIDAGLDSLFSAPGVNTALAGLFGGFRASGGSVRAGTVYVVGEEGPELFTPATGGAIIPAGQWESAVMADPVGTLMPGHAASDRAARAAMSTPTPAQPTTLNINVDVTGARGNAEIEEMVASGVRQGIAANNRHVVPGLARKALAQPRVR